MRPTKTANYLNRYIGAGRVSQLLAVCLATTLNLPLIVTFNLPASAAIGSDVRLPQLETKFFKHTYPKDEEAVRLERLEKMVFGESRSGSSEERLKNLADTVPNLADIAAEDAGSPASSSSSTSSAASSDSSGGSSANNSPTSTSNKRARKNVNNSDSNLDLSEERNGRPGSQVLSGESKYPAVTALEQNIFHRDYASDPVGDRLNRLESKVFGKPSKFTDMSERVDALKEKTKVDIARKAPPGTDWVDEEDDDISFPGPKPVAKSPSSGGNYGRTTSGGGYGIGNMQSSSGAASGAYGMGGGSSSGAASGAYGMGGASGNMSGIDSASMPQTAPSARKKPNRSNALANDRLDDDNAPPAVGAIGLNSQVAALENAVLGKTFAGDPLIERVGRLEQTVFPTKTDASSMSLPERVSKLVAKVPVSAAPPARTGRANRHHDDMDMDDDMDMGSLSSMGSSGLGGLNSMTSSMGGLGSGMTTTQTTQTRSGGLGKIINSIGNMLGGGYVGSYGMPGGAMVRDPSTGFLVDTMSGNLINPSTGQVVGRSAGYPTSVYTNGITQYGGGYGTGIGGYPMGMGMGMGGGYGMPSAIPPLGGYSGFNNGFSPYGYPGGGYGGGYGMGSGLGAGGIRFGGGGLGVRF